MAFFASVTPRQDARLTPCVWRRLSLLNETGKLRRKSSIRGIARVDQIEKAPKN